MAIWQIEAGGFSEDWDGAWKYGILAHPAAHSLSPPMQQAALDADGIDAAFQRYDIPPQNLSGFLKTVRDEPINGLAVSIPHKEAIIPLLDRLTPTAQAIGAVNTVFWEDERLLGENTDAPGFWQAIASAEQAASIRSALIMGAGGTARAMVSALREQGIAVTVANRTPAKADALAAEFGAQTVAMESAAAAGFDLVANATSVGLLSDESPVQQEFWQGFAGIAVDAVYTPKLTTFLADAQKAGATIVTGDEMLLQQGALQFEIWTGKTAPLGVMRAALQKALA